jgi:uncharacterized protein (TIGR03435 family)
VSKGAYSSKDHFNHPDFGGLSMNRIALRLVAVLMVVLGLGGALRAQGTDITGNWQGTLQAGNGLRTVLKVVKDDGRLKATMYSIDQGGQGIPVTTIALEGAKVSFTIKPLDVTYTGTLAPNGAAIEGSATQGGQTHVLNLDHVTAENTWAIPEPPKPMAADAKPKFDAVTVKPSDPNRPGKLFTVRGTHVMTINTNLNDLITFAYGLHAKQIVDGPAWLGTDKFDIDGVPDVPGRPSSAQMKMLIQDVLSERFGLKFHRDERELPVYVLTVAKGGPKMTVTADLPSANRNFLYRGFGDLHVTNSTMKDFCDGMQGSAMDRPVVDHTGLTERYDFTLKWTPDDSQFQQFGPRPVQKESDDPNAPPGLPTALQEQLGLKMEAMRASAGVIVIDHVEKPSAN